MDECLLEKVLHLRLESFRESWRTGGSNRQDCRITGNHAGSDREEIVSTVGKR